jgi:hypothetical protein
VASEREELSEALTRHIEIHGGYVTSVPAASTLRFEAPQNSSLPSSLTAMGYKVVHVGVTTRLNPGGQVEVIKQGTKTVEQRRTGLVRMDVFEITLPPTCPHR